MFKKVSGIQYIFDPELAEKIYIETRDYINQYTSGINMHDIAIESTIKNVICSRVAALAYSELKPAIDKSGYITVTYSSTLKFAITVVVSAGTIAYGELIK